MPWGDPGLFAWHVARYEFALPQARDRRVLDVGCGEGYGAALLAGSARDVVAIDYSPAAVDHARASYERRNLHVDIADARALPYRLGRFDVITCFEVIEHVPDADALLERLAGLLAPGGILLLSTPNRLVDRLFETAAGRPPNPYHVNLLTPRQLKRSSRRHFPHAVLYGQSRRGSALHSALKMLDVANIRHRLFRRTTVRRSVGSAVGAVEGPTAAGFRFSRLLVRQSPIVVLVARRG